MSNYKYIAPQQVRGYAVDESGQLSIINVIIASGQPVSASGYPYQSDNETVDLTGWPDTRAESFNGGMLLIGLN